MADTQAKYNQIREEDESKNVIKEEKLNVTLSDDDGFGVKDVDEPGDSPDQQAEAQCEEDGAGPSNEGS